MIQGRNLDELRSGRIPERGVGGRSGKPGLAGVERVAHPLEDEDEEGEQHREHREGGDPEPRRVRLALPCATSSPSDGDPGGIPNPRKSSEVKVTKTRYGAGGSSRRRVGTARMGITGSETRRGVAKPLEAIPVPEPSDNLLYIIISTIYRISEPGSSVLT